MSHTAGEQSQDLIMRVQRLEWVAKDVLELELRLPDGAILPGQSSNPTTITKETR